MQPASTLLTPLPVRSYKSTAAGAAPSADAKTGFSDADPLKKMKAHVRDLVDALLNQHESLETAEGESGQSSPHDSAARPEAAPLSRLGTASAHLVTKDKILKQTTSASASKHTDLKVMHEGGELASEPAEPLTSLYEGDNTSSLNKVTSIHNSESDVPSVYNNVDDVTGYISDVSWLSRQVLRQLQISEISQRGEWQVRMVLEDSIFPNCAIDMRGTPETLSALILYADPDLEERINAATIDLERSLQATTDKDVIVSAEQRPLHQIL